MIYHSEAMDPHGALRNLVGRLNVDLVRQRAVASRACSQHALATQSANPTAAPERPMRGDSCSILAAYVNAHTKAGTVALEREAVRTRSFSARNMLTVLATGGRYDYFSLAELLEASADVTCGKGAISLAEGSSSSGLLSLARVLPAQGLFATDDFVARSLYEAVLAGFGAHGFDLPDWINYIGLLTVRGDLDRAERLLSESPLAGSEPYEYACLWANILAERERMPEQEVSWLATINSMFELDGIEPIILQDGNRPRIDRISCVPRSSASDGPLVSILMTNYRVGEALDTAVNSVLSQTWRNLELIIVDDCSPEDEYLHLKRLQASDPRIRVFRTNENSGTYTARNLGLAHAKGEFVTCHDSDDWSHPRKIESQVLDLIHSDAIGNLSRLTRTTEELRFERFSATGKYVYPNTSSLMFRREPVLSRLGGWDPVRTGADTELYKRIELVFAAKLQVLPGAPLSFARTRSTALTSGTLGMGWSSPARRYYRASWAHWHQALKQGNSDPTLDPDSPRKFPSPASNLPSRADSSPIACDVLLVADMRCRSLAPEIAREIESLATAGLDVAICHVASLRHTTAGRELLNSAVQGMLNSGFARRVELDAKLICKLVLVRDPTALQFLDGSTSTIQASRVLIATDLPPFKDGSVRQSYTISAVESATSRLFGLRPQWATGHLATRDRLQNVLPGGFILPAPWRPPLVASVQKPRSFRAEQTPVIGFCFPDGKTHWKPWGLLDTRLFPRGGPTVRIMGGRPTKDVSSFNWEILAPGAHSYLDFFAGVDLVPYFPQNTDDDQIDARMAAALAAGCVVLAPPRFAPILGDGAMYVAADDMRSLMNSLSSDRSLMAAQSRRAQRFAQDQLATGAFAKMVKGLLSDTGTA